MISFDNDSTKKYLARKGPTKVFGRDVDEREELNDEQAIARFDRLWQEVLEPIVQKSQECDISSVRTKVSQHARGFISETSSHREFSYHQCLFVCQLPDPDRCDQLWFIPSTSGDPRTLYVKFASVLIKESFDDAAEQLGWDPEALANKILLDFVSSVTSIDLRHENPGE